MFFSKKHQLTVILHSRSILLFFCVRKLQKQLCRLCGMWIEPIYPPLYPLKHGIIAFTVFSEEGQHHMM